MRQKSAPAKAAQINRFRRCSPAPSESRLSSASVDDASRRARLRLQAPRGAPPMPHQISGTPRRSSPIGARLRHQRAAWPSRPKGRRRAPAGARAPRRSGTPRSCGARWGRAAPRQCGGARGRGGRLEKGSGQVAGGGAPRSGPERGPFGVSPPELWAALMTPDPAPRSTAPHRGFPRPIS